MTDECRAAQELVNELLTFIRSACGKVSWYTFTRPKRRTAVGSQGYPLGCSNCPRGSKHSGGSSRRVCTLKEHRVKVHINSKLAGPC